jgi:hypothetical protein
VDSMYKDLIQPDITADNNSNFLKMKVPLKKGFSVVSS